MSTGNKDTTKRKPGRRKAGVPRNPELAAAQEKGHEWHVLAPQEGYPVPLIGWRLMQYRPDIPADEHGEKWVHIQFGAENVLKNLAYTLNRQKAEFPELYKNNTPALSVGAVVAQGRLTIMPKMDD